MVYYKNKRYRKPKGQSRKDNPEILTTLDTQYTGSRQENRHNKKIYKDEQHGRQKNESEPRPGACEE